MKIDWLVKVIDELEISGYIKNSLIEDVKELNYIYIPLEFWFNKDPKLALPVVWLKY